METTATVIKQHEVAERLAAGAIMYRYGAASLRHVLNIASSRRHMDTRGSMFNTTHSNRFITAHLSCSVYDRELSCRTRLF